MGKASQQCNIPYCSSDLTSRNWGGSVLKFYLDLQCTSEASCSNTPSRLTLLCLPESSWVHNLDFSQMKLCAQATEPDKSEFEAKPPKSVQCVEVRLTLYLRRVTPAVVYMVTSKWTAHFQACWESLVFLLYWFSIFKLFKQDPFVILRQTAFMR